METRARISKNASVILSCTSPQDSPIDFKTRKNALFLFSFLCWWFLLNLFVKSTSVLVDIWQLASFTNFSSSGQVHVTTMILLWLERTDSYEFRIKARIWCGNTHFHGHVYFRSIVSLFVYLFIYWKKDQGRNRRINWRSPRRWRTCPLCVNAKNKHWLIVNKFLYTSHHYYLWTANYSISC